ncbi:MAG TPA: tetratricopeptide repeat protein [Desulfatiglandales bacterium]|nr:tetratricopeptide repeat protein [Desulfatiglandales bacterium]
MIFYNTIYKSIRRILYFGCSYGLALCIVAIYSISGCSKGALVEKSFIAKKWTCDKKADEAMKENDYEAAILLHEQFLDREPANGLALYHLGYAYGEIGDHENEVSYYEKAVSLGYEEEGFFFNMGMAYGELNQLENSIQAFKKALDINPDSADNHFGLAIAYQKSLEDKLAEEEFLEAIRIDPANMDARIYLSMLYVDSGELKKAGDQLRKILEIDPSNEGVREFLKKIEGE